MVFKITVFWGKNSIARSDLKFREEDIFFDFLHFYFTGFDRMNVRYF